MLTKKCTKCLLEQDLKKFSSCTKNGKKYKSMLASINNWGGVQFVINRMFKERIYLDTDEVVSWKFV